MFGIFANWGVSGDFPDVGNTLNDDTTNNEAGTYEAVSNGDVRQGTQYGEDGTEHTGNLEVTGEPASVFFLRR
jgi:hypothetical protein